MITVNLVDRLEWRIGGIWCVQEMITGTCQLCNLPYDEVITYQDEMIYYHYINGGPEMSICRLHSIGELLPDRLYPYRKYILPERND